MIVSFCAMRRCIALFWQSKARRSRGAGASEQPSAGSCNLDQTLLRSSTVVAAARQHTEAVACFFSCEYIWGYSCRCAHDQKNAAVQAAVAGGYYDDLHRLI
jgi:hypothetical protein